MPINLSNQLYPNRNYHKASSSIELYKDPMTGFHSIFFYTSTIFYKDSIGL